MKRFLNVLVASILLSYAPIAIAAEWVKIAENTAKDSFFVDKSSVQRRGDTAWYWEYREFQQPNNAFLDEKVAQPIYGLVINWSVDCVSKAHRLRQATAYNKERKVIQKFNYGDKGRLEQAKEGSSISKVLDYVCTLPKATETKPSSPKARS